MLSKLMALSTLSMMVTGMLSSCGGAQIPESEVYPMVMKLTSVAFEHNGQIPEKYSCRGEDINPPLQITDIPKTAKSLVLIVDDPDAPMGTWDHWIMYNIPPINSISENSVPSGAMQGRNSFSKLKYGGPCPPSGTHRYFFKLFALNSTLDLSEGVSKQEILLAIQDKIVDKSELIGLFTK